MGGGGRDGLNGYKANLSPAKLNLADIGLELSLAIFFKYSVRGGDDIRTFSWIWGRKLGFGIQKARKCLIFHKDYFKMLYIP